MGLFVAQVWKNQTENESTWKRKNFKEAFSSLHSVKAEMQYCKSTPLQTKVLHSKYYLNAVKVFLKQIWTVNETKRTGKKKGEEQQGNT